jgi:hypothetical protein
MSSTPPPISTEGVDPIIAALVNIIQTGTSPQILAIQQALLRRLLLEGNVGLSRIPAPRNITEFGGYLNLLDAMGQTTVKTEAVSSALGVAPPQVVDTIMNGSQINPLFNNPANPAPTTSQTLVMSGLGVLYTPILTGRVKVTVQATLTNSTLGDGGEVQISLGKGTAPSNNAALTGQQVGAVAQSISPIANAAYTITAFAVQNSLTVGTQYWFDLAYAAINGGSLQLSNITFIIEEF